jgi:hypothetical protein
VVAFEADQLPAIAAQAVHKPLDDLSAVGATIHIVAERDDAGRLLSMVRDLCQRYFEKIEAAMQISYGVSLAHR